MTALSETIATSTMLSSGGCVVKYCNQSPGIIAALSIGLVVLAENLIISNEILQLPAKAQYGSIFSATSPANQETQRRI